MLFETDYNKEQIISIFNKYTIPYNFINSTASNAFVSKFKNDKIYLFKTGVFGIGRGQSPLEVKLIENGNNITLDCKFKNTLTFNIVLYLLIGFAWLMVLNNCILNSNFDLLGKFIVIFILLLWSLLCVPFLDTADRILFSKQRIAVIEFLGTYLHARRIT